MHSLQFTKPTSPYSQPASPRLPKKRNTHFSVGDPLPERVNLPDEGPISGNSLRPSPKPDPDVRLKLEKTYPQQWDQGVLKNFRK